jgi:3-hydroxyisobutyrate dehydrogenase
VIALMKDVSSRCTHMGPVGAGLAAKMINQLIVGCTHAVLAEALLVAEAAGIDAARIPECLAGGHADGTLLQRLYPRMAPATSRRRAMRASS